MFYCVSRCKVKWWQPTLLVFLLGDHCHGHSGLGARLSTPQWQPADLQRAEIALESVFGGGVPLLHVFLPFCRGHPVVHLKSHQLGLTATTAHSVSVSVNVIKNEQP